MASWSWSVDDHRVHRRAHVAIPHEKAMRTLALTLFVVGAAIFGATVLYCIYDQRKTGVRFRNKKAMFPPAIIGWLIAMSGFVMLSLNQEG
jgi:energy-converting hydrogenase Eha subunit G